MKKLVLTIAIVFGMAFAASAQYFGDNGQPRGGGLFGRGAVSDESLYGTGYTEGTPLFPNLPSHFNDENQDAPLGGGVLLLIGFGAAYAMTKKNRK